MSDRALTSDYLGNYNIIMDEMLFKRYPNKDPFEILKLLENTLVESGKNYYHRAQKIIEEIELKGGRSTKGVVRLGNTVRRPHKKGRFKRNDKMVSLRLTTVCDGIAGETYTQKLWKENRAMQFFLRQYGSI